VPTVIVETMEGPMQDTIEGEVIYEVSGKVACITINRPERRNALNPSVIEGLYRSLGEAATDDDVRVVVITGAGDKAFCAGADLEATIAGAGRGFVDAHYARGHLASVFERMAMLGKPIVARVNGHALAGGLGLACAADFVIASEAATFGTPEVDVGLWPMMITVILRRCMAPKRVLQLMLTGRRLGAQEAKDIGLVDTVVPAELLDQEVDRLCRLLAEKSPQAVRMGRDAFYRSLDMPEQQALAYLQAELSVLAASEDAAEGIRAFLEKREPRWKKS
jgi:enoyl-CoA hydratase/carnithine racemase